VYGYAFWVYDSDGKEERGGEEEGGENAPQCLPRLPCPFPSLAGIRRQHSWRRRLSSALCLLSDSGRRREEGVGCLSPLCKKEGRRGRREKEGRYGQAASLPCLLHATATHCRTGPHVVSHCIPLPGRASALLCVPAAPGWRGDTMTLTAQSKLSRALAGYMPASPLLPTLPRCRLECCGWGGRQPVTTLPRLPRPLVLRGAGGEEGTLAYTLPLSCLRPYLSGLCTEGAGARVDR